jgi:hypothetical protein
MHLFASLVLVLLLVSASLEARTWKSSDGREIDAELVRVDGDVVLLLMGEKEFRVPVERLSDADQEFLKTAAPSSGGGKARADGAAPGSLFGEELVVGKIVTATGELSDGVKRALSGNGLKPAKMVISVMLPEGFDPTKPQKVFWGVGGINNEAERLKGNLGVFNRGVKTAVPKGWVLIGADTEHGNPRETTIAEWEGDVEFHQQVVEEMVRVWPGFKSWQHVCGGFSSGSKASFFRVAQLLKEEVNVVGAFFGGCNQSLALAANDETRMRKSAFRKTRAWISSGKTDKLVSEGHDKSVEAGIDAAGYRPVRLEKYEGGHSFSTEEFVKALDWFVAE